MLNWLEWHFNKFFVVLSTMVAAVVALKCWFTPFAHDEVATFYYYIQPESFIPFLSHIDANGHFLTNITSWICYKAFGSSEFALRLPNLFAFVILCFGTFKFTQLLNGVFSKYLLSFGLIGSYHFISFYALCRGYGISMAFLVLALYYFFSCIKTYSFKSFLLFLLFAHLALSANLTLVFVLLITSFVLIAFQIVYKQLFKLQTILIWLSSFALLFFWIKYAFYLQQNGALYYGSGDSYWQVTFASLIETVFFKSFYLNTIAVLTVSIMFLYFVITFRQQGVRFLQNSGFAISFSVFLLLVMAFYFLKLIMHVNYPEDRTGLFFYVFFIMALSFKVSESRVTYQKFSIVFPSLMLVHFIGNVNLSAHPWPIYETFPKRFVETLIQEQKKADHKITIAGHRLREFIFGFMNYNNTEKLNHITSPEALQMNADYAIAYKKDQPYYQAFYTEIDSESNWNFVLLKRKEPIKKELIFESTQAKVINGDYEYINTFEKLDTTLGTVHPLLAEFKIKYHKVKAPFNAWLVIQIDDASETASTLVRIPLNLIQKDFKGDESKVENVLTGNIPKNIKRIVCYLWNIDKQPIEITIEAFKLFRLNGEGITIISKAKI